ncbi:MAG: PhoH family protein [Candidatus Marinimicrobia bacterium]|jgi:phosphate starvation-inducible PhoH-like protein|nr:PhoH family protein [Candidatus Neomarinimicrobiota bacterium]MBT3947281.1 PhoH family protein [Candidatus Neomarinimicrobiota bacterium]MBT4063749.1 PhoH family protein [Candidatus Neomarinimicrobiota bacterium]MBT4454234.1 PhoH family protein [Candidatus Neomarinimicrobiota bacterium]MBT5385490.1 PhoH family protein [Candidatus Neomarinimicrobiota bacterium]
MEKTIEMKGMDLGMLFGPADANLKLVEGAFASKIIVRGNIIKIDGDEKEVPVIHEVFHEMGSTLNRKGSLTQEDVKTLIRVSAVQNGHETQQLDTVVHYGRKGAITARTDGQKTYIQTVRKNDIVFSVGPAGTGKTYLAVAFAVAALDNREVDRIILCRPAVEAGENLGFLPGDLKEKVDPYLTPLYDALGDMMPATRLKPLLANNTIEIIPLAYMRGRTLNNAFMILDEAQNATTIQMKMFLTRLGVNSRAIITGDITQIDLPSKSKSGLLQVIDLLQGIDGLGFCKLDASDVVRHKLVRDIIKAYDHKDE